MISRTREGRVALLILAAGFSLGSVLRAQAEPAPDDDPNRAAVEVSATVDDIDPSQLDWSQLNVDPSTLTYNPASKARPQAKAAPGSDPSWSSNNQPNGSTAVAVKQPLSSFWDARIGADMTVARQRTLTGSELLSERLANGGSLPESSGTAWAAISAPGIGSIWDKTAVEARIDPSQEQTRLGTSLSKSVPLSEEYSLTLQNGYNVIQQGIIPLPGIISHPARSYETDQSAKLSITETGTSFIAGQSLSTADDKWLRKIGAEQKVFGDVTISGSIGETSLGTTNKSLSAGFKKTW